MVMLVVLVAEKSYEKEVVSGFTIACFMNTRCYKKRCSGVSVSCGSIDFVCTSLLSQCFQVSPTHKIMVIYEYVKNRIHWG